MKILLVVDYAAPVAGAEISTLRLRDGLRARGHDVRVFATDALAASDGEFSDFRCRGTTGPLRGWLQTCNPWAYVALRRVLRTFQPDVVSVGIFLTQLSPFVLPLLRDVPTVYRAHWRRSVCPVGTKQLPDGSPCASPWGRACLRNRCLPVHDWVPLMIQMKLWWRWREVFDAIAANSDAVAGSLAAHGLSPVVTVHPGTDDGRPAAALADPPTIVFAGRLVPKKGVDVLLDALARVCAVAPATRALIAGDGPEMPMVRRRVAAAPLAGRVELCGHLTPDEMAARFAGAWVQVVPSRYEEPFGLVAIEAMMRGTAVVASRTGGLAEIVVEDETGLLVPPANADALAAALLTLVSDRTRAARLGDAGQRRAREKFSTEAFVTRFEALLTRVARSGAAA